MVNENNKFELLVDKELFAFNFGFVSYHCIQKIDFFAYV